MQSSKRRRARLYAFASVAAVSAAQLALAQGSSPPPVLSQLDAMNITSAVAHKVPGMKDLVIAPQPYDASLGQWVTLVKPEQGEGFIVTLDEKTGEVCARYEHRDGCAARGDATADVARARAVILAKEEAKRNPAPDMEGLWIAVLTSQIPTDGSFTEVASTWYVSVTSQDGSAIDLPASVIATRVIPRIKLLPDSQAPRDEHGYVMGPWHYSIGTPLRREDGMYDVPVGSYCGPMCASSVTFLMSHDASGWHVINKTTNWVS